MKKKECAEHRKYAPQKSKNDASVQPKRSGAVRIAMILSGKRARHVIDSNAGALRA